MMPFLKLQLKAVSHSRIGNRRSAIGNAAWLGFASGCAFTVIVFAIVTLITR